MAGPTPHFYDRRRVGSDSGLEGAFENTLLRPGTVIAVIHPTDARSRSRKFVEYDVYAVHRENGTAVSKMYHAVCRQDALGGTADWSRTLLRAEPTEHPTSDRSSGNRVLLLCISGAHSDAVILGGLRDDGSDDLDILKTEQARHDWVYNGVEFHVGDDGSVTVNVGGATDVQGELRQGVEAVGASVVVAKDGSVTVSTRDGSEVVKLDRAGEKVTVHAKKTVLDGEVRLGEEGAAEGAVMGSTYRGQEAQMNQQLVAALQALAAACTAGPLSPLSAGFQAAVSAIQSFEGQSSQYLSRTVKVS